MAILLLDTSQSHIICGILKGDQIFETLTAHANNLGSRLSLEVQQLIQEAGLTVSDLTQIKVGVGPGSYTGTRVGVAFAEALAFGLNIPLIKLPSLLFYIAKDHTELALKSNFGSLALITINNLIWDYKLLPASQAPELTNFLDTKQVSPQPDWPRLCQLRAENELKELLYFSLT
jgi:tRNA threonylcarbamoyl adenosine modification protein YeaZ